MKQQTEKKVRLLRKVISLILSSFIITILLIAQVNPLLNESIDLIAVINIPDPVPISAETIQNYIHADYIPPKAEAVQRSINSYAMMPYGFHGGEGFAINYGLKTTGGLLPGYQQLAKMNPRFLDPYYDQRNGSISVAAGMIMADGAVRSALSF